MTDPATTLAGFLRAHPKLLVLTGAGVSTGSGIPDYRDADGQWKRRPPITGQVFRGDPLQRARYWARSMIGWPLLATAQPNAAHRALARLQDAGRVTRLVTQNVDGLHQAAGSTGVIDLHGRLDVLVCLACGARTPRSRFQSRLHEANPDWTHRKAEALPDGDADLEHVDFSGFVVPACTHCGGLLKPDVVFFGENVPRERVDATFAALAASDGLLVVGSSLMVYSGYRFAVAAQQQGLPIAVLTQGRSRADPLAPLKIEAPCGEVLPATLEQLGDVVQV
ncbi:MAG: NAD-dependent protein deacetylase [Xanthomonadaceae bacterium]|nr:NAD-dependent protein deacetylase [Xanthomonadaceae bacterium]